MKLRAAALGLLLLAPALAANDLQRCRDIEDREARLACFDAIDPATTTAPAEETSFPIKSRLVGPFRRWEKGTRFTLENKQVWEASSSSRGFYPGVPDNPEVTITETFMGATWLEVAGTEGRKIKVKRVQ